MILVSGAAGKTGRAVVGELLSRGAAVRALVLREGQAEEMRQMGVGEVVVGDMRDEAVVTKAVRDVSAVYHIAPNMHPDEVQMGRLALVRVRESGGGDVHFVYHSVLHPQTEEMPHHWRKLQVEALIFRSGLPFTILQPAAYVQNVRGSWDTIVNDGRYRVPYPVTSRLSLVHLGDVAQAAATVLLEPGHAGATYELAGTAALDQTEVAAALSKVLDRPVVAEALSLDEWRTQAKGLPADTVETLLQMFRYYAAYGLVGNPQALTWLLGRKPTTLVASLRQISIEMVAS
ncbi:MAG TPA: NmrA family NAD(P)-binding protein [Candidatus Sulfomarinibacteraceae bacterium]|nr:NmrA family NAD(P)-binding protein [Candidatus Sulfomarinibacteraceae bacterium]